MMSDVQAAVTIQKVWRGYQTRNLNPAVKDVKIQLRHARAEDNVLNLMDLLEETRRLCASQDERIAILERGEARMTKVTI